MKMTVKASLYEATVANEEPGVLHSSYCSLQVCRRWDSSPAVHTDQGSTWLLLERTPGWFILPCRAMELRLDGRCSVANAQHQDEPEDRTSGAAVCIADSTVHGHRRSGLMARDLVHCSVQQLTVRKVILNIS